MHWQLIRALTVEEIGGSYVRLEEDAIVVEVAEIDEGVVRVR